jgi:hypothetical protein
MCSSRSGEIVSGVKLVRSANVRHRCGSGTSRTKCKHRTSPAVTGSLESLRDRKNERMFEEKSISRGNRGGIIVVDLHMTRRRPVLICLSAACAIVRIFLASALTWCAGTMAAAGADLYRAQAIVTGQGETNRIIGFASCLEDVLIKVSGAQKLAGDRRLAAYKSNAKSFVEAFSYHDQMSGSQFATSRAPAIDPTI